MCTIIVLIVAGFKNVFDKNPTFFETWCSLKRVAPGSNVDNFFLCLPNPLLFILKI